VKDDQQETSSSTQELRNVKYSWTDEEKALIEKATSLASTNAISIHHYNESVDEIVETLDQKLLDVSSKISLVVLGRNSPGEQGLGKQVQKILNKDWFDVLAVEAPQKIQEEQAENKENENQV